MSCGEVSIKFESPDLGESLGSDGGYEIGSPNSRLYRNGDFKLDVSGLIKEPGLEVGTNVDSSDGM